MKALNTEILLEYLVEGNDNTGSSDLFFDSEAASEIYFLNNIVMQEVITSFEENVKFDKSDILTALRALTSNSQIRFENREVVTDAVGMYKIGRAPFSECLKTALNRKYQSDNSVKNVRKRRISAVL